MYRILLTICCVLATLTVPAFSQTWDDSECLVAKTGCGPWLPTPPAPAATFTVNLQDPECNAVISYRSRMCGTEREIVVTGLTVNWGCGGFDDDVNFHYAKTGLKEYLIQGLLYQLNGPSLPTCPTTTTYVSVYSAACGIWACCEYTLPPIPTYQCEPEWGNDPPPHYGTLVKKVQSCKWKACGTICCERKYSLCQTTAGSPVIQIISKTPLGTCTSQRDASPPFSKPCQDGC